MGIVTTLAPRLRRVALLVVMLAGTARAQPAEPRNALTSHEQVVVGMYLNDIQAIDLKLHNYVVDFYIWFRWRNPNFDPSTTFEFTNANQSWTHVRQANFEAVQTLADGTRYQVVHVQGNFAHKFLFQNYPFDRQVLEVSFEDAAYDRTLVTYVPDTPAVTVNKALLIPGFEWDKPELVITSFEYPTNFGNLAAKPETYSRVTLRVAIHRPAGTYAIKLLLPIACVIICTALMFLLRPTYVDARWSIGITALLTIVALQITLNSDLPDVDYLVLMDKIYICAYLYVICGLGALVATGRMVDSDRIDTATRWDRRAMMILLGVFLVAVTTLLGFAIAGG